VIDNAHMDVKIVWSVKNGCHVSQEDFCKLWVALYPSFIDAYSKIRIPEEDWTICLFRNYGMVVLVQLPAQLHIGSTGVARGGQRGHAPPKFLENTVILCFERRFSKQNSVIRLKTDILLPPKFLGWLRYWSPDASLRFPPNKKPFYKRAENSVKT